ncbi:hypothetical protein GCM10008090_27670 [Arenicella chitinivorans]|uniref:Uncharacterized protein n=1 Tax=Arenicella chitinivorans TaxID=1329800 RepID=A0A918RYL7_9GAMM|nr:hypothetical protein [Arenicella chitinivorans]GHA16330.1 hypothetical protein GCM10008090_27670 [Arenicella chitinivorans]
MSKFNIHEFDEVSKKCLKNSHCKVIKINSYSCGGYESLVYSSLMIKGESENYLLELAKKRVDQDELEMSKSSIDVCTLVVPKPTQGVCWKNGCETIRTWR